MVRKYRRNFNQRYNPLNPHIWKIVCPKIIKEKYHCIEDILPRKNIVYIVRNSWWSGQSVLNYAINISFKMLYLVFGGEDCAVKYSGRDSNYRKSAQYSSGLEILNSIELFMGNWYFRHLPSSVNSVHIFKNLGSLLTDLSTTIAVNYKAYINYLAPSCFPWIIFIDFTLASKKDKHLHFTFQNKWHAKVEIKPQISKW